LGCSDQSWRNLLAKLGRDRLLGRFFAATRAKLREIAEPAVCGTWSTWRVVRLAGTIVIRRSHRRVDALSPCRGMDEQQFLKHI
jgi:hypothetical protein